MSKVKKLGICKKSKLPPKKAYLLSCIGTPTDRKLKLFLLKILFALFFLYTVSILIEKYKWQEC